MKTQRLLNPVWAQCLGQLYTRLQNHVLDQLWIQIRRPVELLVLGRITGRVTGRQQVRVQGRMLTGSTSYPPRKQNP